MHDRPRKCDSPVCGVIKISNKHGMQAGRANEIQSRQCALSGSVFTLPANPKKRHRHIFRHGEGWQQMGMCKKVSERSVPETGGIRLRHFRHILIEHFQGTSIGLFDHPQDAQKVLSSVGIGAVECRNLAALESCRKIFHPNMPLRIRSTAATTNIDAAERNHGATDFKLTSQTCGGNSENHATKRIVGSFQILLDEVGGRA